jgi:hypothetical protein
LNRRIRAAREGNWIATRLRRSQWQQRKDGATLPGPRNDRAVCYGEAVRGKAVTVVLFKSHFSKWLFYGRPLRGLGQGRHRLLGRRFYGGLWWHRKRAFRCSPAGLSPILHVADTRLSRTFQTMAVLHQEP